MVFQGQEFLEDDWFHDQDPIDWSKKQTYHGIFKMYQDLIRLRRNGFNNTRGLRGQHVHVHHVNNNDKVVAFHRWEHGGPGDDVVIVVNMGKQDFESYHIGFPREGMWHVRFNSDSRSYDADFGNHASNDIWAHSGAKDNMPCNGKVGLGPYSAIILSQDNEY
jgi:1,4-alpha-glucan branching enzyme